MGERAGGPTLCRAVLCRAVPRRAALHLQQGASSLGIRRISARLRPAGSLGLPRTDSALWPGSVAQDCTLRRLTSWPLVLLLLSSASPAGSSTASPTPLPRMGPRRTAAAPLSSRCRQTAPARCARASCATSASSWRSAGASWRRRRQASAAGIGAGWAWWDAKWGRWGWRAVHRRCLACSGASPAARLGQKCREQAGLLRPVCILLRPGLTPLRLPACPPGAADRRGGAAGDRV